MQNLFKSLVVVLFAGTVAFAQGDKKPEKDSRSPLTSKTTNMKLMPIPAGTFMMGARKEDSEALVKKLPGFPLTKTWEPQHKVELAEFYMGTYEVTQGDYKKVMGKNPSGGKEQPQFPVTGVSWFDAIEFCNKLSEKDGLSPRYALADVKRDKGAIASATVTLKDGNGYRLPTEAEWEYACRAGTETQFNVGDTLAQTDANFEGRKRAKTSKVLAEPKKVGSFKKNAFGLFDMHGNVSEFCFDAYTEDAYQGRGELTKNPVVATGSESRVIRGGTYDSDEWQVFSYSRQSMSQEQPWSSSASGLFATDGRRLLVVRHC